MQKSKLQCGFGLLGLCCTDCLQGPCRIDPFQKEIPSRHLPCRDGEGTDIIVIKNLLKRLAMGTAIYSNYGHQILKVKSERGLTSKLKVKSVNDSNSLKQCLTKQQFNLLSKYNVLPSNICDAVFKALAPGSTDINELLLIGIRCSLANLSLLHLISDFVQIGQTGMSDLPEWCVLEVKSNHEFNSCLQNSLVERIKTNDISGVVIFVGCTKISSKEGAIFDELSKNSVIPIFLGCQNAGHSIGSCIEAVRVVKFVNELSFSLGIDISMVPMIAIFSEQIDRRIEVMAYWMMALGIPVYWMKVPPIIGSTIATEFFTKTVKEWFGGYFMWEKEGSELINILRNRAKNSGLKPL